MPQNKAQEIKTPTKEAKKEVKSEPQKKEGKERTSPKKEAPEIKKKYFSFIFLFFPLCFM